MFAPKEIKPDILVYDTEQILDSTPLFHPNFKTALKYDSDFCKLWVKFKDYT